VKIRSQGFISWQDANDVRALSVPVPDVKHDVVGDPQPVHARVDFRESESTEVLAGGDELDLAHPTAEIEHAAAPLREP